MRRHVVDGGPDEKTGANIIVIEDDTLTPDAARLECAFSERDFAYLVQSVASPEVSITVMPKKGFPRKTLHFIVSPCRFDYVVELFEDPKVEPMTNSEVAIEILRATRRNN